MNDLSAKNANRSDAREFLGLILPLSFFAAGVFCAGVSFPQLPDDRRIHLVALLGGILVGLAITVSALTGNSRLKLFLTEVNLISGLLIISALFSVSVGVFFAGKAFYEAEGASAHELWLRSSVFIGVGMALGLTTTQVRLNRLLSNSFVYYSCLALTGVLIPLLIYWCGMRQFGGFDHSILIDYGWRLRSGQRPFVDFPSTAPIGFFLGAYYAFLVFGVSWQALVLAIAVFAVVVFFWSAWLLSQLMESRLHVVILAITLQATCIITVSYWWYNPTATAIGVLFVLSTYAWMRRPEKLSLNISFCASLCLLASMKPNIAGCMIVPTVLILLLSRAHRVRAFVLTSVSFLLFFLWLHLHRISLLRVIRGYHSVTGQAFGPGPFFADPAGFEALLAIVALAYVSLPLAGCFRRAATGSNWRYAGIGIACILGALNNYISAGETKLVDLGLIFFGVFVISHACGAWQLSNGTDGPSLGISLTTYLTFVAVTMACAGLAVGLTRHRVRGIGPKLFFEYNLQPEPFTEGFFRGMRTGQIFKDVYAQTASIVKEAVNKRIFFGPRMQWAYAAFKLPSPKNHPVWWHPGVSFPRSKMADNVSVFEKLGNDVLVFVKDDMTYFPPDLVSFIQQNYAEDQSQSELTIFHRGHPAIQASPASPIVADKESKTGEVSLIKRVLTTTVQIDVPSVPPNGNFGTRVTLAGVMPSDQLLISPTGYAGTWGIYYESNDTVVVNYNNSTGSTANPPPITFRITALQF